MDPDPYQRWWALHLRVARGETLSDAGGTLAVEHSKPLSAGGSKEDDNRIDACFKCNQFKGDFFPNALDRACDQRVLHPHHDDLAVLIRAYRHTGELEPIHETGRFHIALLQRSRPALAQYQLRKQGTKVIADKHERLKSKTTQLRGSAKTSENPGKQAASEVLAEPLRRMA